MTPWPRRIVHADMDAFYAAVEQLDHPELRGKPLLVGHPGRRGVVTTASYEARPYGVGSAMPMVEAMRRCPLALVVPPRMERYAAVSRQVMEAFARFSPAVEPLSLDEAFLECTGSEGLFGDARLLATAIKDAVRAATGGLVVSVGVAPSKYVAKVASDIGKPDGLVVVEPGRVLDFLHPLPVRRLWGVGRRAAGLLAERGLETIGEVAATPPARLEEWFGALGRHIAALAAGEDPRRVTPERDSLSIGSEHTLEHDIRGAEAIVGVLRECADTVARRLRAEGLVAAALRVKLKSTDFQLHTRQCSLPRATDNADELVAFALRLLERFDLERAYRLVGLAGYALADAGSPAQGELFEDPRRERIRALDRTLDRVHSRFGLDVLRRGAELEDDRTRPPHPPR
jgi:DNA polymerase-4